MERESEREIERTTLLEEDEEEIRGEVCTKVVLEDSILYIRVPDIGD